jgi:Protein of unknown function (DUF742)
MTTGPDGERRQEPTFADVMNGFGLDSGRPVRRRLFGRRRAAATEPDFRDRDLSRPANSAPASAAPPLDPYGDQGTWSSDGAGDVESSSNAVRPYTWTRGRTKSGFELAIETLVSTNARGRAQVASMQVEHRAVAELCEQTRSVAEIAALLSVPLGVARVLLGDMAGLGVVTVHQTASSAGSAPDLALMERVLSGLRRL